MRMTFSYIPMHFMFLYKVFWSYTKPSGLIQSLQVLYKVFRSYTKYSGLIQSLLVLYKVFRSYTKSSGLIQSIQVLYKVFWSYTKPSGLIKSLLVIYKVFRSYKKSSCLVQSLLELYVYIVDYDAFSLNDPVDEITIPLSKADGEFSPSMTYYGVCERASLTVQFRITSECPSNQYGPQCTKECVGVQRITFCNYIGDTIDRCPHGTDCVCEGNFLEPNCILCDENYYPPDLCNVQCIPQDNSFGHYTCDPQSGDKVCLEGYTDRSTFCVEENEGKGYLLLCNFFLGSYHADAGSGATTGATTAVSVILIIIACCALCCCAGCYGYCKQLETDVATTTPSVIYTTRPIATSATMPKIVIQDPTNLFTLSYQHSPCCDHYILISKPLINLSN